MESQGIVIWVRAGTGSLILWCADSAALVYVADRRRVGDADETLCVGDLVDIRVETLGEMRVGKDLRFRAAGAGWLPGEMVLEAAKHRSQVISPNPRLTHGLGMSPTAICKLLSTPPANHPKRSGTGAA